MSKFWNAATRESLQQQRADSLKKNNYIDKPLTRLTKEEREHTQTKSETKEGQD